MQHRPILFTLLTCLKAVNRLGLRILLLDIMSIDRLSGARLAVAALGYVHGGSCRRRALLPLRCDHAKTSFRASFPPTTDNWMLGAGCWVLDAGCWMLVSDVIRSD
jgi:hypothetical protein